MASCKIPKKYPFLDTGSHGYLKVPFCELKKLKIDKKISKYSKINLTGNHVYLEEDMDLTTFMNKKGKSFIKNFEKHIDTFYTSQSFIDNLSRYG